jgi:hypothetical protein
VTLGSVISDVRFRIKFGGFADLRISCHSAFRDC